MEPCIAIAMVLRSQKGQERNCMVMAMVPKSWAGQPTCCMVQIILVPWCLDTGQHTAWCRKCGALTNLDIGDRDRDRKVPPKLVADSVTG